MKPAGSKFSFRPVLGFALALVAALGACGRDGPTTPAAMAPGGRVALRIVFPQGQAAAIVDTIEASVFAGVRRIAGPVDTLPDQRGRFSLELPVVQAGPGRRAAVRLVAHGGPTAGGGPQPGTWYLGLSSPFTLSADDTVTATVTVAPYTTVITVDQSSFIGSAELRWSEVANATGYRLRELRNQGAPIDWTTPSTSLVVDAEAGTSQRTFEVRAESPYAVGAWSSTIAITIIPEEPPPQGGGWQALDTGQTLTPGARIYHAGAFHEASRTLYVLGGMGPTGEFADSLLWAFSLADGTWSILSAGVSGGPAPRMEASMAVSPDGNFVYLFGGQKVDMGPDLLDLWRFDRSAGRWALLSTTAEARQADLPGNAGIDAFIWAPPGSPVRVNLYAPLTAEVFSFNVDGRSWGRGAWSDQWLPARFFPACVYNSTTSVLDTYGGVPENSSQPDSSLWVRHELEGGRWERPSYGAGPPPPSRQMAALALRDNGHLVLFGGIGPWTGQYPIFDDVWEFTPTVGANGGTWSQVNAGGTIGVRFRPTLGYDPTTHRLITFGGLNNSTYAFVWALTLQ